MKIEHVVALAGHVLMHKGSPESSKKGSPVADVRVELWMPQPAKAPRKPPVINTDEDAERPLQFNVSKADGSFYFLDLMPGDYELKACHSQLDEQDRWAKYSASMNVSIPKRKPTVPGKFVPPVFVTVDLKKLEASTPSAAKARSHT
jgi:hypothetical protein